MSARPILDRGEAGRRRAICIAVDDFGLHPGICRATLHLADMGRVHAVGCMVGGAWWSPWHPPLARLREQGLDVGLHLDLTERPLTGPPLGLGRLIVGSLTRRLDARSIRSEIGAQLDRFETALGRAPDFVDGHQHVHQLRVVRDQLLDELRSRYGSRLPWLRSTRTMRAQGRGAGGRWREAVKPGVIASLGARALAAESRGRGFAQNRRLLGVYSFVGDQAAYLHRLGGWLRACNHGDLLMCHPSRSRDAGDPLIDSRHVEYQALAGDGFGRLLHDERIDLRAMSRILVAAADAD